MCIHTAKHLTVSLPWGTDCPELVLIYKQIPVPDNFAHAALLDSSKGPLACSCGRYQLAINQAVFWQQIAHRQGRSLYLSAVSHSEADMCMASSAAAQ